MLLSAAQGLGEPVEQARRRGDGAVDVLGELIVGDAVLVVDGVLGVDADVAAVVDAVVGHGPGTAPVRVLQDVADHAQTARVHGAGVLGVDPEDLLHLAVEEEVEGGVVPDAAEVPLGVDDAEVKA